MDEIPTGDYGLDNPAVVRSLGVATAASMLVTIIAGVLDLVGVMAVAFATTMVLSLAGLVLVRSSRVHKIRERERLVNDLALGGDERVLDVGCGRGLLVVGAARRLGDGGRAVGIDAWEDGSEADGALENAAVEGVLVDVLGADTRALPFVDESFDAVVSGLALHHIDAFDSRVHVVREVARVLRPGGRVVLIARRHTRHYFDALRASNLVEVARSRLVWRLLPPARYVTARKVAGVGGRVGRASGPVPAAATGPPRPGVAGDASSAPTA